jgi:hypothetical protein
LLAVIRDDLGLAASDGDFVYGNHWVFHTLFLIVTSAIKTGAPNREVTRPIGNSFGWAKFLAKVSEMTTRSAPMIAV